MCSTRLTPETACALIHTLESRLHDADDCTNRFEDLLLAEEAEHRRTREALETANARIESLEKKLAEITKTINP